MKQKNSCFPRARRRRAMADELSEGVVKMIAELRADNLRLRQRVERMKGVTSALVEVCEMEPLFGDPANEPDAYAALHHAKAALARPAEQVEPPKVRRFISDGKVRKFRQANGGGVYELENIGDELVNPLTNIGISREAVNELARRGRVDRSPAADAGSRWRNEMIYLAFSVVIVVGIAGGVYLISNGHPVSGWTLMVLTMMTSVRTRKEQP
jgi:hypothetical protein